MALFNQMMEELYQDFHKHLLSLKTASYRNAWAYTVDERQIHPQVVADSMLGAVPSGYDVAKKFAPIIEHIKAAVKKAKKERKNKKGRPAKNDELELLKTSLSFVLEVKEKLVACVRGRAGWLCFFYTSDRFRITAIRFREPFGKRFVYFNPWGGAGLFGHGLFSPYKTDHLQSFNELLIVTEGEFNQLQLQSLIARRQRKSDEPPPYTFAVAVGGVHNADMVTLKRISPHPIICYDNDKSGAGFELVKRAQETISVSAFTTPEPDSDLDSFIRSFGSDDEAAFKAVRDLLKSRAAHHRSYTGLAKQIFSVRQKKSKNDYRKDYEIHSEVAEIILADMKERGRFYHNAYGSYFLFETDKRLIEVSPESDEMRLHLANYGLNATESIHRYIVEALWVEAWRHGEATEIHRFCTYNSKTFTIYLYNQDRQIYRITPESIELVDNGTDGVLFLYDRRNLPFEIGEPDPDTSWIDRIIVSKINFAEDYLTPQERCLLFTFWFLGLFFESIMRTKVLLAFIGEKGSGKTITLRKVGMAFFGSSFDVMQLTEDSRDFDAAVSNNYYVVADNADSKIPWLNDKLACVATGGTLKKREYYTTNRLIEIPTKCFLGITSRTPYFRRDDVVDRLLIFKVDRFSKFSSESLLLNEVITHRNKIMTETAHYLKDVVGYLQLEAGNNYSSEFRMADFADFTLKIGRHTGLESHLRDIFQKLTMEQSSFTLEDDPIYELLTLWATNGNSGREITNTDLCSELAKLADAKGMEFPYKEKTKAFSRRMTNVRANLAQFFKISDRPAGGHKKLFSFTPKEDASQ